MLRRAGVGVHRSQTHVVVWRRPAQRCQATRRQSGTRAKEKSPGLPVQDRGAQTGCFRGARRLSPHPPGPLLTQQIRPAVVTDGFRNTAALPASCWVPAVHRAGPSSVPSAYSPRFTEPAVRSHQALFSELRGAGSRGTWREVAGLQLKPRSDSRTQRWGPPTPLINYSLFGINSKPKNICSTHISTPQVL